MKVLKVLSLALLSILSLIDILFIALIIYYYPAIDRLYIQTCSYYPETFKDCKE